MFSLAKWYLDVVTDRGAGAILYSARLRWGPLRARFAAALHFDEAEAADRDQVAWRGVQHPRMTGDVLTWSHPRLRADGRWIRDAPPVTRRILDSPDGAIDWICHMPRARARVRIGDAELEGLGYAELVEMSISPRKLPFHALRWGRHLSPERWLAWIELANGGERRWVWLDGVEQQGAVLAEGLPALADGRTLRVDGGRELWFRSTIARMRGPMGGLLRWLAGPVAAMRERKRVASSALMDAGRPAGSGWTVYEQVTW